MKKRVLYLAAAGIALTGTCGQVWAEETEEPATILVAAAASLEYSMTDELIPLFRSSIPGLRWKAFTTAQENSRHRLKKDLRRMSLCRRRKRR